MIKLERMKELIAGVEECYKNYFDDFPHEYDRTPVPYGDTFVSLDTPTDRSVLKCDEAFKQDFSCKNLEELIDTCMTEEEKTFIIKYIKEKY